MVGSDSTSPISRANRNNNRAALRRRCITVADGNRTGYHDVRAYVAATELLRGRSPGGPTRPASSARTPPHPQ
jgi:hypothetical protein